MKRLIFILVLLAAIGGGGYYYYAYSSPPEKPQVVQVTVSQGDIVEEVQATGTLEALRVAPVGSQVSGVVKALYADFNSIVTKDQVIAEIDPALFQVQVDLQTAASSGSWARSPTRRCSSRTTRRTSSAPSRWPRRAWSTSRSSRRCSCRSRPA